MITDRFGNIVPDWYADYFRKSIGKNVIEVLAQGQDSAIRQISSISDAKSLYRYAPEKWSVNEVLSHVIDCERIFAYRALAFSRHESTPLPGFDENNYIAGSNASERTIASLLEEYISVRHATLTLFRSFNESMLSRTGIANNRTFSVEMIGFIIAGHEAHHLSVLIDRYSL